MNSALLLSVDITFRDNRVEVVWGNETTPNTTGSYQWFSMNRPGYSSMWDKGDIIQQHYYDAQSYQLYDYSKSIPQEYAGLDFNINSNAISFINVYLGLPYFVQSTTKVWGRFPFTSLPVTTITTNNNGAIYNDTP